MYYDDYQSVANSTAILEGLSSYFIFAFIISIVYAVICAIIASKKDRNPLGWAALGFLCKASLHFPCCNSRFPNEVLEHRC